MLSLSARQYSLHVIQVHERVVNRHHGGLGVRVHGAEHHAPDASEAVDSHVDDHDCNWGRSLLGSAVEIVRLCVEGGRCDDGATVQVCLKGDAGDLILLFIYFINRIFDSSHPQS